MIGAEQHFSVYFDGRLVPTVREPHGTVYSIGPLAPMEDCTDCTMFQETVYVPRSVHPVKDLHFTVYSDAECPAGEC